MEGLNLTFLKHVYGIFDSHFHEIVHQDLKILGDIKLWDQAENLWEVSCPIWQPLELNPEMEHFTGRAKST
jgi:hypothetical protein